MACSISAATRVLNGIIFTPSGGAAAWIAASIPAAPRSVVAPTSATLLHMRRDLLEQLQPSGAHLRLEVGESGDVPAGVLAASVTLAASKPPGNDSQEYGQPSRS